MHYPRPRFLPGGVALLWLAVGIQSPAAAQTMAPGSFNLGTVPTPTPTPIFSADGTPAASGYQPPKVLTRGPVAYPILANLNRIEGTVGIHFVIDESGKVTNATVNKSSHSLVLDAVVKSRGVMEWTFQPAMLKGKPIPSTFDQEFEFRLDPNEQREFALKRLAAPVGTPDPPYPPAALAFHPPPRGDVTVGVYWTPAGLVGLINLVKSSGSATLDHAALSFAYQNWRIDPKEITDPKIQFTKVLTLAPPDDGTGTPPPLATGSPSPSPTAAPTPKSKRSH